MTDTEFDPTATVPVSAQMLAEDLWERRLTVLDAEASVVPLSDAARDIIGGFIRDADVADRPRIVCLCGSTRFYAEFQEANYDLTMQGMIVLSVGFYPHSKAEHGHGEGVGHDSAEKVALDELHKRKIDLADEVLVLNVGGYIGDSTRSEVAYAYAHGKPVRYLVQPPDVAATACREPHAADHRCFDCATDDELAAAIPPFGLSS